MSRAISCFKAFDVRGRIPDELNEDVANRIGKAYAQVINPGTVVVGHDIRLTSESIKAALVDGLRDQGVNVVDIGLCGTEEIYFATAHLGVGGGIVATASHNPKDYNGMKFVRAESKQYRVTQVSRKYKRLLKPTSLYRLRFAVVTARSTPIRPISSIYWAMSTCRNSSLSRLSARRGMVARVVLSIYSSLTFLLSSSDFITSPMDIFLTGCPTRC